MTRRLPNSCVRYATAGRPRGRCSSNLPGCPAPRSAMLNFAAPSRVQQNRAIAPLRRPAPAPARPRELCGWARKERNRGRRTRQGSQDPCEMCVAQTYIIFVFKLYEATSTIKRPAKNGQRNQRRVMPDLPSSSISITSTVVHIAPVSTNRQQRFRHVKHVGARLLHWHSMRAGKSCIQQRLQRRIPRNTGTYDDNYQGGLPVGPQGKRLNLHVCMITFFLSY